VEKDRFNLHKKIIGSPVIDIFHALGKVFAGLIGSSS